MPARQPQPLRLPAVWLFTDARLGDALFAAARALPPGSGIVIRHDDLPRGARWRLVRRLARLARARGHMLLVAGSPAEARRWGADGVHLRQRAIRGAAQARRTGLVVTMPVHDAHEARAARRAGAHGAFVSPLHPTRSHPETPALGRRAWLALARLGGAAPVALGGMIPARARALCRASGGGAARWAAIGHWLEKAAKRRARQKRNAVPI
ncbi:MAG TPA: thiamine phosphate synthase [Sphingopyxis sp.]|nr:thiamine phosphate synthase [Sphingopyxis sp.]HMP44772.1 thiamine phosphate synthase [Sphingopyxis sp.]HMQ18110.1 thiamine phosphate synthase [Sphingopyxis sp.]